MGKSYEKAQSGGYFSVRKSPRGYQKQLPFHANEKCTGALNTGEKRLKGRISVSRKREEMKVEQTIKARGKGARKDGSGGTFHKSG